MHHTPFVRGVECLGDLFRHAQRLAERQRPAPQSPFERLATNVLHDDAGATVERGDFVNRADERVIERGGDACFAEQLLEIAGLAGSGDELQGDFAIEHHVIGEAHLSHASAADDFEDLIPGLVHHLECYCWSRTKGNLSARGELSWGSITIAASFEAGRSARSWEPVGRKFSARRS